MFWQIRQDKCAEYRVYRCQECKTCPHFGKCTTSKKGRTIWRRVADDRIKAMRTKLDSDVGKAIYAKRKHIVEPVFGHIKAVIGFTGFHLRGLDKVNGEFTLVAIAHNLKKISKWVYKKRIGLRQGCGPACSALPIIGRPQGAAPTLYNTAEPFKVTRPTGEIFQHFLTTTDTEK